MGRGRPALAPLVVLVAGLTRSRTRVTEVGQRACTALAEGLARTPAGGRSPFARLCRLRVMLGERGVVADDDRIAALAVRQFQRAANDRERAEVLVHAADTGDRVVEALQAELARYPEERLARVLAEAVWAAPRSRDPFAVALLLAAASGRVAEDGWVSLLPFGEFAVARTAYRRCGPVPGIWLPPVRSDRILACLTEERDRAVAVLRRLPPDRLARALRGPTGERLQAVRQ